MTQSRGAAAGPAGQTEESITPSEGGSERDSGAGCEGTPYTPLKKSRPSDVGRPFPGPGTVPGGTPGTAGLARAAGPGPGPASGPHLRPGTGSPAWMAPGRLSQPSLGEPADHSVQCR
jgi:hypothetical protein